MTKMQPLNIIEATAEQVRTFATNFLGLDLEPEDTEQTIFAKVMSANGQSEVIFIQAEPEATDQTGTPPPAVEGATRPEEVGRMQGSTGKDDPRAVIFINNEDRNGETYDRDVAVGVNGTVWLLKRNMPLNIPMRVLDALQVAVRDSVTHDKNHDEVHTSMPAIPFSVQSMPPAEDVAAYRARTADTFCP